MAMKRNVQYLQRITSFGLTFSPQGTNECTGYSDANCGGDVEDCKSMSGFLFQVSGCAVSWWSNKQSCMALYCWGRIH